jgi:gliding motility-associated-like protein
MLYRAQAASGGTYTQTGGIFAENDTVFTDKNLNTEDFSYNYRIVFLSANKRIDSSATASNPRLSAAKTSSDITLSWNAVVPWVNNHAKFPKHAVFMRNSAGDFEKLDSANVLTSGYTYKVLKDLEGKVLQPKKLYCFYVTTVGTYDMKKIAEPLLNKSQILCASLLDDTPPCPPTQFAVLNPLDCSKFDPTDPANCGKDSLHNVLTWFAPDDEQCDDEDVQYKIYFAPKENMPLELLASVKDTFFVHKQFRSVAGCYQIAAVDGSGNETARSAIFCLDNCPYFMLPNVFTPNGDGKNDVFRTIHCPLFVESVEFTVYNRWEQKIYEGKGDIFVNWNGKTSNGGQVPSGVYFYEAKVKFIRLKPDEELKIIKGWIQILGAD